MGKFPINSPNTAHLHQKLRAAVRNQLHAIKATVMNTVRAKVKQSVNTIPSTCSALGQLIITSSSFKDASGDEEPKQNGNPAFP